MTRPLGPAGDANNPIAAPAVGQRVIDVVIERVGGVQRAMSALARYGLADAAQRSYDLLSGGQKARLEILCLELEGNNLLLLDEPTDNLDIDSSGHPRRCWTPGAQPTSASPRRSRHSGRRPTARRDRRRR